MKLSDSTRDQLKNFASINQGIVFKAGNKLRTISILKNVFATAEIADTIPRDFAIYDLNEFLSTLSLFGSDADIDYKDDHVQISSGKSKIKYYYSSPTVVVQPGENDPQLTDPELEFTLTISDLNQIQKASAALKLKELQIDSDKIVALNSDGVANQISIDLEDAEGSLSKPRVVKIENLKVVEGPYKVRVFETAIELNHITRDNLRYLIAIETA